MKRFEKKMWVLTAAGLVGVSSSAMADDVAFDDFDGNANYTSRVFSPDNNASNGVFNNGDASRFDRFGIVNRSVTDTNPGQPDNLPLALPFDVVDDSATTFPTDTLGVLRSTDVNNNVVLLADAVNSLNPNPNGAATITWEFDVSGYENLNLSVDFAMVGDFEASDFFSFGYYVDGDTNTFATTHNSTVAEDTLYTVTMENGSTYSRYANPFFDGTPSGSGPNDGPGATDLDGDSEFVEFKDPVVINGTQLTNEFQTISAPITQTGDTLTLVFQAIADASLEYFLFDNVLITGDLITAGLLGDYNGNGMVDAADYTVWADNFNSTTDLAADGSGNGIIDAADYTVWADNFGNTSGMSLSAIASSFPVPEPSAGLILAGLGLIASRRRRSA